MERFLYRLAKSPHADRFVLKGALMMLVWKVPVSRPTMDIDLHRAIAGKNEVRVFDYVDRQVPMLARMFARRDAGYRSMGYRLGEPSSPQGAHRQLVVEYDDLPDTVAGHGDRGIDEVQ